MRIIYSFFLKIYHFSRFFCLCFLDEEKFEEMNKKIQLLKTQKEKDIKDKEKLKRQVLEKKTKNVKHLTIGCKKQR